MKRALVFQHMDHDHPGRFLDFFTEDSIVPEMLRLWEGQEIPSLTDYDLMFVLGGKQDVWQEAEYPWLAAEKAAIREWVAERAKPYIGVCLGHQLLAAALGGTVAPADRHEVGVFDVALTEEGRRHRLFAGFPPRSKVMQWHFAEVKQALMVARGRGGPAALTDLAGGQIDLMCDQTTNTTSQIEGKKVKAFAVTTSKRLSPAALKDLPTLQEAGLKGFEVTIWHGLYAPKGTPADIQNKLSSALKTALKDPEFIKKQEGLGAVVVTDKRMEPAEHKKFVAAEIAKWSPVIKAAGVYAD